jgi:hypothetical protein
MTFQHFYSRVYLPQHPTGVCRLLHLVGAFASAILLAILLWLQTWWWMIFLPVPAYLVAWLGHLLVPNQPSTFHNPVWSFFGYRRLVGSMIAGKAKFWSVPS